MDTLLRKTAHDDLDRPRWEQLTFRHRETNHGIVSGQVQITVAEQNPSASRLAELLTPVGAAVAGRVAQRHDSTRDVLNISDCNVHIAVVGYDQMAGPP